MDYGRESEVLTIFVDASTSDEVALEANEEDLEGLLCRRRLSTILGISMGFKQTGLGL